VVLVDLREGFRMMSSVLEDEPGSVRIGDTVCVLFDTDASGEPRAVFRVKEAS
jgi:uncharacterized OB-fold protein